jgi:microcin C transport system substrate-binding protein
MQAFAAGEYTFRQETSSKEWATSYDFPAVERGWVVRETLPDGNISAAQGFVFNLRRDKWQDPRVRDAVRMLFNFEWSNETLFYGLYQRPYSFWGGSDLAAEGMPGEGEVELLQPLVDQGLLDPTILTEEAAMPPENEAAQNLPDRRTRRQALRLLNEAGWETGDDGMLRNAEGQTLELVIIQFNPTFDRIVNPYIENLRSVGIDARLERIDRSQYIERRRTGEWDLTNQSPGQGFEPSLGLKQWFGSETAEDSSRNIMALADPAVDSLIDTVIGADNLEELRTSVRALDRVLRDYGFWIPQWGNQEHWVAYWDQYDHPETLPPLALGVLDFWWFDEEGAEALREAGAL